MKSVSKLKTKFIIGASAMAMALTIGVGQANATLIGDEVGCNITGDTRKVCTASTAVVGASSEFGVGFSSAVITVDIGASTIDLTFNTNGSINETIINLTDMDWVGFPDGIITAAVLTSNNGITGLAGGDITFGDHNVSINLMDTEFSNGASALITLTTNHSVPEPASLALFGFGLLGLGLARRRRRRKTA